MHISKGFGLWMWVAAVDHRDAILFPSNRNDEAPPHTMPTVRLPVDNFPCSQIYKGFALGEGGDLPHLARERTEEPIGGGNTNPVSQPLTTLYHLEGRRMNYQDSLRLALLGR